MKIREFLCKARKILRALWKISPSYFFLTIVEQGISRGRPFLALFLGAGIIDGIACRESEGEIFGKAMVLVISNMFLAFIQWAIDKILIIKRRVLENEMDVSIAKKSLEMDYQVLEKAQTREYLTKIREGMSYSGGFSQFCQNISVLISSCFGIFYVICTLIPLFLSGAKGRGQGIYGVVNSWLGGVLSLVVSIAFVVYYFIYCSRINKIQKGNFEFAVHSNRIFSYLWGYTTDYQQGKGIRIYHMADFIRKLQEREKERVGTYWLSMSKRLCFLLAKMNIVSALMLTMNYLYIGLKVLSGAISIGQFTFYAGALAALINIVSNMLFLFSYLDMSMQYLIHYIDYLELPNEKYDGTLPIEKRLDNDYELEFRNVSFHYPNNDAPVLKNITAKIHVGRKMAIVGRNGSGKSTFIKLLCRLYDPTEGEILLNGIDIRKYDYDEYRRIFGVVFQDFQLYSFPVAWNVAAGTDYHEEKVWKALEQAGLKERVLKMEKEIETIIYKQEDEGIEISGGEAQKIAIARALYKDAPVVILDEPTAALDPVSELEIYERFDEMVKEKTAIYISHRMSSCRFCENILVFEDGNIVQMGRHADLLEQEGLYANLWQAQAQYYQG